MTGRAAGFCAGYPDGGYTNFERGRRFSGRGPGRGRGWRNFDFPQQQQLSLRRQAQDLQADLDEIKARLNELEK